ncbi:sulfotransferase [Amycolatopsis magusensis]|uniref:Uncharacterized protein n=1 Tax=Amycolatopsis magusensis TaxID=882444 RepID=A0ABS4PY24_9PSEU|nr:sulfotransferase [Amycolatopsis magusensis]MBP2183476.1 hypothetical protein [Amycolatopsis magusensis]
MVEVTGAGFGRTGTLSLHSALETLGYGPLSPHARGPRRRGRHRHRGKDETIAWFLRHNEAVEAAVPASELLVYRVTEGWGPLCGFLGTEVPAESFPRVNDSAEVAAKVGDFLG